MRVLLQRVISARVRVAGEVVGEIGPGLLVFLGVAEGDGLEEAEGLATRLPRLRLFADSEGRSNLSLLDTGGEALVISQFTLCADLTGGNRPSFTRAAPPELADRLYRHFLACLAAAGPRVATGRFGASMQVELVNDGPATYIVDSRPPKGTPNDHSN
ncbi:MAG: D-tyrosyl-tRNA(Tyr) deacylase [Planctomycetota bacterium]|jgi:D-tyrosyl-tRNA(Tyr) deacylase|nr:D-tyrosyl-tRNA(Tyr) deacylase [Planctomycetota bacterium]